MGYKKVIAYALDENAEHLRKEDGSLAIFWIFNALKMRSSDPHNFRKLTFKSMQKDPDKRNKVFPVKNGFYRYERGVNEESSNDKDANSLSHSMAIAVLSQMREIRFLQGKTEYHIKVKDIRIEDLKIQLTNRDKYQYYYPDLICLFDEPAELCMKWGGKIAIEVKDTHGCEYEKIHDFENHGIPILEVSLKNITLKDKLGTDNPSTSQLEEYYKYLKDIFNQNVDCKILSNPVSREFHKISIENIKNKYEEVFEEKENLIAHIRKKSEIQSEQIQRLKALSINNESRINKQFVYIKELEKRGVWYHFKKFFSK